MSWLYETWSIDSEKNGRIECKRLLGEWSVDVQGCSESSSYMRGLWKSAIRRIPKETSVKRILMLGLAAGCSVEHLHRRFPGCRITAVEWDPAMIEVMDRLRLFKLKHRPEILLGDAAEIVPTLREKFDLILFDLYQGRTSPLAVQRQSFFEALRPLLVRDGFLIVNAYAQPNVTEAARAVFSHQASWMFRVNGMSLFRPIGAGTIGDALPEGYRPFRSIPEYCERDVQAELNGELVGTEAVRGTRRWQGISCVEKYYGDAEPLLDGKGPKRLVIWQPTTRNDIPTGWERSFIQMNASVTGFVDREATADPLSAWSSHAQRQLKRWRAQEKDWDVVTLSLDEFLNGYRICSLRPLLKDLTEKLLRKKAQAHGERLHCFGFKSKTTGAVKAGFAALDVPEGNQAIHIASFLLESARHDGTGTGLVYEWFKDAERRNIRFLDFDLFRGPHESKSWKGFSRFKAQFGTIFIKYPHPLARWEGTWRDYFRSLFRPHR
jgi:precorrin-6B methylase 2